VIKWLEEWREVKSQSGKWGLRERKGVGKGELEEEGRESEENREYDRNTSTM